MAANNTPTAFDKEQLVCREFMGNKNTEILHFSGVFGFFRDWIFGMAEKEMEYRVELFNKLTHTCFNKCIEKRYKESELNMGENSCIDRCVSKYWQVTNLIGQLLGSNRPPM